MELLRKRTGRQANDRNLILFETGLAEIGSNVLIYTGKHGTGGPPVEYELRLEAKGPDRTLATLLVEAPWLSGFSRALPRRALTRLHALCQTAAEL